MNDIITTGPYEEYRDAEIAVDLSYENLILSHLRGIDSETNPPCAELGEQEPRLGLRLVKLLDVERTANKVMAEWGHKLPKRDREPSPLETVLGGLRLDIGEIYGGWFPPMGKNRVVRGVDGQPHIGTGGSEYPKKPSSSALTLPDLDSEVGRGVRVGIIDTALYPHSQLQDRWFAAQSSVLTPGGEYDWLEGHSTFVAGLVLAAAPGARIEVRGLLKGPDATATVWDVATAMADFIGSGVSVLNLSLGCYTEDGQPPLVLDRAIEVLWPSIMVVAAAGNHGATAETGGLSPKAPIFPAACRGAVAVGAVDGGPEFGPASFSPQAPWVQLVAPGVDVKSTYLSGKVLFHYLPGKPLSVPSDEDFHGAAIWSGTSFATGTISGEIAARTKPGETTPQRALAELLAQDPTEEHKGIGRYVLEP